MLRRFLNSFSLHVSNEPNDFVDPLILGMLSFAGYSIFYAQNIFLARSLTLEEFNDYNVGVSSLLMLAALAPLGLEKLTLKIVPVHMHRQEWSRLRGFLRFATFTTFLVSLLLTLVFDTALGSALPLKTLYGHVAIPIVVASLPLLAVFSVFLEIATASGAPILAAILYRLALPLVMLTMNLMSAHLMHGATGGSASISFVAAWFCVTSAMMLIIRKQIPDRVTSAPPRFSRWSWLRQSTPLLFHGLLLTAITQSGVIVLELSEQHHSEASVFAIAMQTGTVIVLFATTANRFYLPRVSVLLKTNDTKGLIGLARQRLFIVGGICLFFFALIMCFGRLALRAHGDEFEEAYLATCIIAIGASISTTFSLSPFGLHYIGLDKYVIKCICSATIVSISGCVYLANKYGATGAAIAYAIPMSLLHLWLAYKSKQLLESGISTQMQL